MVKNVNVENVVNGQQNVCAIVRGLDEVGCRLPWEEIYYIKAVNGFQQIRQEEEAEKYTCMRDIKT